MYLMWEYQRFMVHLPHTLTADHPPPIPCLSFNVKWSKLPNAQKHAYVYSIATHLLKGSPYMEDLHRQCAHCARLTQTPGLIHTWLAPWCVLQVCELSPCQESSCIHWFLWSVSLSSSSPPPSSLRFAFSVMVTCEGTRGVTFAVGPRQITVPEIDQPFLSFSTCYPFVPVCFMVTVSAVKKVGSNQSKVKFYLWYQSTILLKGHIFSKD